MTTVVNYETGEIVERLNRDEAERLSNRIALRLDTIADNYEAVVPMIRESVEREAWSALGYRSPGEYAADRFGGALSRLGVEFRQAVTRELSEMGMSTRAIAGVVGAHQSTVVRDLAGDADASPGPTTGIDGKTYSRPEPREQTSRDVPDQSYRALSRDHDEAEALSDNEGDAPSDSDTPQPEGGASNADPTDPRGGEGSALMSEPPRPPSLAPASTDEWTDQDRAEELAGNLARNLSLLYAVTNPQRRAEYIATWRLGIRSRPVLGQQFITPKHMRELATALQSFASEWETAHA